VAIPGVAVEGFVSGVPGFASCAAGAFASSCANAAFAIIATAAETIKPTKKDRDNRCNRNEIMIKILHSSPTRDTAASNTSVF